MPQATARSIIPVFDIRNIKGSRLKCKDVELEIKGYSLSGVGL